MEKIRFPLMIVILILWPITLFCNNRPIQLIAAMIQMIVSLVLIALIVIPFVRNKHGG